MMPVVTRLRLFGEGESGTFTTLIGDSRAALKSSVAWMGSSYGIYIDLDFDYDTKISKTLTAQLIGDSSTDEDSEKTTRKGGGGTKKKGFP